MEISEAYHNLRSMEIEQSDYFDRVLRRLEKIHNPPHVVVHFQHLIKVMEARRERSKQVFSQVE